jgi:hypothetical protein
VPNYAQGQIDSRKSLAVKNIALFEEYVKNLSQRCEEFSKVEPMSRQNSEMYYAQAVRDGNAEALAVEVRREIMEKTINPTDESPSVADIWTQVHTVLKSGDPQFLN